MIGVEIEAVLAVSVRARADGRIAVDVEALACQRVSSGAATLGMSA
jgi:hypothetical protein